MLNKLQRQNDGKDGETIKQTLTLKQTAQKGCQKFPNGKDSAHGHKQDPDHDTSAQTFKTPETRQRAYMNLERKIK